MSRHNALIFIDSFPYAYINRAPFLSQCRPWIRKVLPGFGYSINLKAEIFGGYLPDQAGFLNEWSYCTDSPLRTYRFLFNCLGIFQKFYYADRVIHRGLSKISGCNIQNIPLRYLAYFARNGTEAYRDQFHLPTLFTQSSAIRKICYYHYDYGPRQDLHIFSDALKAIEAGGESVFAAFGQLDGVGHRCGVGSVPYEQKIAELDSYLSTLYQAFSRRHPEGAFIVFSDHGMANVHRTIQIDMESRFGPAGENSYLYFIDATMLRVWCFNKPRQHEIERYLETLEGGKVLDHQRRASEGISLPALADIIFHLDEGFVFCPSFMGRKSPLAMHGYHHSFPNQVGFCLCRDAADTPVREPAELSTIDLYQFLKARTGLRQTAD
jgi:hypothetical protein